MKCRSGWLTVCLSPSSPWQGGIRQQGWYTTETLIKQFPNLTVQFILSLSTLKRKTN